MSVLKSKRKLSSREASKVLFDLHDMIIHDTRKIPINTSKYVVKRVNRVLYDINELMYAYNDTYATKGKPENHLRRNIYIILMNKNLVELHKTLLPFIIEVPRITPYRIAKYTEIVNEIISLNEHNFKRNIKMDDYLFDRIEEYDRDIKRLCKEIMENKDYKFQYCHYYIRSSFEKAEFVKSARDLERYTLSKVKKLDETRRILYGESLHMLTADIFYYCHKANSIFPICKEEYVERMSYLKSAKRLLENFDKTLARFLTTKYYNPKITNHWSEKYYNCAKLVNAIINYDNSHFKNLPAKDTIENFDELKQKQYEKTKETENKK